VGEYGFPRLTDTAESHEPANPGTLANQSRLLSDLNPTSEAHIMNWTIKETPSHNQETTLESPCTRWTLFAHKDRTRTWRLLLFFGLLVIFTVGASQTSASAQTTIGQVPLPFSLQQINGHKIVATATGLSAVFADGTTIKYATSTNGGSWSVPTIIATNAFEPTIAVAGNIIGIAYGQGSGSSIYYRYKSTGASWSTPVQITVVGGAEPAMVGYGSTMYLTWATASSVVSYTSFPANSPSNSPWEIVSPVLPCGTTRIFKPAIAVVPVSSSNSSPVIRVAYFYQWSRDFTCPSQPLFKFGFTVSEKGQPTQVNFTSIYSTVGAVNSSNSNALSMAMAANRSTGEFYLAVSELVNGVSETSVVHQDAWKNGPWQSVVVLPRESIIDVTAASCSKFRIAVSDFTMGNGSYGPTWYRTGEWSGQNPTWAEPNGVQLSSLARDPQALFWTGNFGLGSHRDVHGMYDEQVGTSYFIKHDAHVFSGQQIQDCRIRNIRDEKQYAFGDDVDSH
jgi:hypothetical protein